MLYHKATTKYKKKEYDKTKNTSTRLGITPY